MTAQAFSIQGPGGVTRRLGNGCPVPGRSGLDDARAMSPWMPRGVLLILCWLASGAPLCGQEADDPVERSMQFVDQSMKATDLFNEGKITDALAVFRKLLETSADLDEDGYVALSIGDCLAVLDRREDAKAAYEAAEARHRDLAGAVDDRLVELELAGNVSDSLIDRLRFAATSRSDKRFTAAWQLGRGLQKRAQALLLEAASAFRMAAQLDSPIPKADWQVDHMVDLDDLNEQAGELIERLEKRWGELRRYLSGRQGGGEQAPPSQSTAESRRYEWTIKTAGGEQVVLRELLDKPNAAPRFTANGKPIQLDEGQADLIRRYQERIDHILLEAANKQSAGRGEKHE